MVRDLISASDKRAKLPTKYPDGNCDELYELYANAPISSRTPTRARQTDRFLRASIELHTLKSGARAITPCFSEKMLGFAYACTYKRTFCFFFFRARSGFEKSTLRAAFLSSRRNDGKKKHNARRATLIASREKDTIRIMR